MKSKKAYQLGMNPSTANSRLRMDLLFRLAVEAGHKCYRCGKNLDRETFTVEHKIPWLDSDDPVGLYFDLDNIAFSHHSCNSGSARQPTKKYFTDRERLDGKLASNRRNYCPIKRREQYLKHGH